MLPEKAVRDPGGPDWGSKMGGIVPAYGPEVMTVPEKSPWRSAAVGTVENVLVPFLVRPMR